MATNTFHRFMCVLLCVISLLSICLGVFARSCSPGTFCPIGTNCTTNTSLCTIVCPTETDCMQQGNHLTGNCERIPDGTDHWMDSTLYEVFILSNQPVNIPILSISFISTDEFQTNGFTYRDLVTHIIFNLNGSCPYFYFTNMLKEVISFENYYDLYVPDDVVSVSLALAETVPPDDYEMEVTVTDGDTVLQRRDIIVHVRDVPPCTAGPETFVEFSSTNFTISELAGSLVVTLVSSGKIPSQSFIIGIIAEADNSSEFPATAGGNFTAGRYNATFITGATTANTSIPIMIAGSSDGDVKQFNLRLFIDGAAYQQCVFSGNISTATVFVILELTCQRGNGGCDQVCSDTETGVNCSCLNGYQLVDNQTCPDIDECLNNNGSCSHDCVNTVGSYNCDCPTGYYLQLNNHDCEEINECLTNNGGCSYDCVNTVGSYYCDCPTGHNLQPNNYDCEDINECLTNNGGCSHSCINTIGSYYCECPTGYSLQPNNHDCRKKLTCQRGNGGCDQVCSDTETGVNCSCLNGYQLVDNQTCSELTCQHGNGGCDQVCNDTPETGVNCSCLNGYQLVDSQTCSDIDECTTEVHNCTQNQQCVNRPGSYVCECVSGYELLNGTCEEVTCQRNNGGCDHMCSDAVIGVNCSCHNGYQLVNEQSCTDIDECLNNNGGCSHDCVNTIGSYYCECPTGHDLHDHDCEDIDECLNTSLCSDHCINTEGSYHCDCFAGYTLQPNQRDCEDINECLTNDGCHTCTNTEGSFECLCNTSYILAADNKTCVPNVTSCDYVLEEPSGHINTSGFPNSPYAPYSNCTWIIDLPAYKNIELKFIEMDIEESPNCVKDQVTILNGKDEDTISLGSYCGNKLPAIIHSSTETVIIKFISDGAINNKGFNLQYRGLKERNKDTKYKCNLVLSGSTRFALSTFPSKYNHRTDCVYYFLSRVKLTFLYLDIVDADCSRDRIEIYNGFVARTPSIRICNGNKVVEFISSASTVRMRFIGNSVGKYRGFHALVTRL